MPGFTEDILVQQTTATYMAERLGWESVYAFDTETFGPDGTLGRASTPGHGDAGGLDSAMSPKASE